MPAAVVVGAQWGDEGKGKVTDFLAQRADIVVRYQGGDNAGHTVVIDGKEYRLFLVPSGVLRAHTLCVLGNGMVIDPKVLVEEIDNLKAQGHPATNIRISHAAHLVMPYHRALDEADEERLGSKSIGTTKRGIGPAYLDKYSRCGVRMADLLDPGLFAAKVKANVEHKNEILSKIYSKPGFDSKQIIEEYLGFSEALSPYIQDTSVMINDALKQGKNVLFEGAQGTMLEIDHGTYPYVTSSYPTAGGACIGAGVGPTQIDCVIGVVKAYSSRVGNGPFPTELHDQMGDHIRERGHEYGTRTGRPRRVGWLDAVGLRMSVRVNSLSALAITRLDTLSGIPELKICTAYRLDGKITEDMPLSLADVERCEPIYEKLDGWEADEIVSATAYELLPTSVKRYVETIEALVGVEAKIFGIGQDRAHTIVKGHLAF